MKFSSVVWNRNLSQYQLSEEDPTESKVEISEEVAAFTNVNQEELENFNVPYLEGLPDSTSDLQSRQVLAVGIPLPESPKKRERNRGSLFHLKMKMNVR